LLNPLPWRSSAGPGSLSPMPSAVAWSWRMVGWGLEFVRACLPHQHAHNLDGMRLLAWACTQETRAVLNVLGGADPEAPHPPLPVVAAIARRPGTLFLYGSQADFDASAGKLRALQAANLAHSDVLTPARCQARFPWLAQWRGGNIAGGCAVANSDFSADARSFTRLVADSLVRDGVTFLLGSRVTGVVCDPGRRVVTGVVVRRGDSGGGEGVETTLPADILVIAAGMRTRTLVQEWFSCLIPLHSMRGYSLGAFGLGWATPPCTHTFHTPPHLPSPRAHVPACTPPPASPPPPPHLPPPTQSFSDVRARSQTWLLRTTAQAA
jgi:glycine/D-amino acid oxidase-like deaminating enzyme